MEAVPAAIKAIVGNT
ncbi:uncharacterized protein FRV6_08558 [Fusarium oxysporum]|uniref:Uncharacterized protein n=1 Tax=Fusarium oxysporum TaxID=5507 RepID=A0A2H3TF97_FUSOX|nr:uncharacterized protein FRV6_08558 [Fusarium oxysporum]